MTSLFSVAAPAVKQGGARYVFPEGKYKKEVSKQAFELAKLLLSLSKESAIALKERRFSTFDALLMSQGCQITAMQVYSAVMKTELFEEAGVVEACIPKAQAALQSFESEKVDLTTLQACAALNFPVSSLMLQMIRFYLLRQTRDIKPVSGVPRHVTDIKLLNSGISNAAKESLLRSLQKEEASQAADFILQKAKALPPFLRKEVVINEVAKRVINKSDVTQVSIFYSLEVALRGFLGCVKVVDLVAGGNLFFKLPESRQISGITDEETPVLVIEGYFDKGDLSPMIERVEKREVLDFILTAAAQEVRRDPVLGECTDDMKSSLSLAKETDFPFQMKHFYIASGKEAK